MTMATMQGNARPAPAVLGLLLAGGGSRRMGGGDKCLRRLRGTTLLQRVIDRAAPQVAGLLLSANGDPSRFATFGLPVVADDPGPAGEPIGPLGGILAGMEWAARHRPDLSWIASLPTDTPFLPGDLVARLAEELARAEIIQAASRGWTHHLVGLWPVRLAAELREAITTGGTRRVQDWVASRRRACVTFVGEPDPFLNLNRPEELAAAESIA